MRKYFIDPEKAQINLFDERWYKVIVYDENDKPVEKDFASVTTKLDAMNKGKGFELWLMNTKDPMAIRDEAGQLGSLVHKNIERLLRGESLNYIEYEDSSQKERSLDAWERTMFWYQWWGEFNKAHKVEYNEEDIECIVCNPDQEYAGTVDLLALVDGEPTVFDWKTGAFIGDSAEMQVAAYAKAIELAQGMPITTAYIIQINPKLTTKKKYKVVKVDDIDTQYEDFLHVCAIWSRLNKNAHPKYKVYPTTLSLKEEGGLW